MRKPKFEYPTDLVVANRCRRAFRALRYALDSCPICDPVARRCERCRVIGPAMREMEETVRAFGFTMRLPGEPLEE